MSRKRLLLNFLALSCLACSSVSAAGTKNVKNSLPPSKTIKNVSSADKTDNFFVKNKSNIVSGLSGLTLGACAGVPIGYIASGKTTNEKLEKAKTKIVGLENELNNEKIKQSTGAAELKNKITELTNQNKSLETQIANLVVQINNTEGGLASKKSKQQELESKEANLAASLGLVDQTNKLEDLKTKNDDLNGKIKQAQNKISDLNKDIGILQQKVQEGKDSLDNLTKFLSGNDDGHLLAITLKGWDNFKKGPHGNTLGDMVFQVFINKMFDGEYFDEKIIDKIQTEGKLDEDDAFLAEKPVAFQVEEIPGV